MTEETQLERMAEVGSLLHETFELNVYWLNGERRLGRSWSVPGMLAPRANHEEAFLAALMNPDGTTEAPVIHTTVWLENFVEVKVKWHDRDCGSLVIGPVLYARHKQEMIEGLIRDYDLEEQREGLCQYFASLPVLKRQRLLQISALAYYMVYGRRLDIAEIVRVNQILEQPITEVRHIELDISNRLHEVNLHQDPVYERRLMQLIREGRREELVQEFMLVMPSEGIGTLARKSMLRNQKNLTIVVIALATRAAVDGGVHPEVAYTMSDLYIQQTEELTDIREVVKLMQEAIVSFADRVQLNQEDAVSHAIARCKQYLFTRLYEDVTLAELARLTNLNASYLSRLFKKETGLGVREYVQVKRVEEAKKLLAMTEYPLSDICTRLNFHDQSYFTKVFKKVTGLTPREYRNGQREIHPHNK